MTLMEIRNRNDMHPIIQQIDYADRTSAAGLMWFITSKLILFFIVNIVVLMLFIPTSYELINENKRRRQINDRSFVTQVTHPVMMQVQTIQTNEIIRELREIF